MTGTGAGAIRYTVQGGSPRVDVTFEVDAGGRTAVRVFTEASLPQAPPLHLGSFATVLDATLHASLLEELPRILQRARAEEDATRPVPAVFRLLSADDGDPLLVDPFTLPEGFEEGLRDAGVASLADPVSAVEVGADLDQGRLLIRSIGADPFPILLLAEDVPGYFARCWRDDPAWPEGVVGLDDAAVRALAAAGEVPIGPTPLEEDRTIALPLPPPPKTGEPMTGNFIFWWAGPGGERRIVAGTW
jgi:hypothetical protein